MGCPMAAKSKTETLRDALLRNGWKNVGSRSKKYECYAKDGEPECLFLGKAGALRRGRTSSDTIPVSHLFIERLMVG